jgi:hypothetical protein
VGATWAAVFIWFIGEDMAIIDSRWYKICERESPICPAGEDELKRREGESKVPAKDSLSEVWFERIVN